LVFPRHPAGPRAFGGRKLKNIDQKRRYFYPCSLWTANNSSMKSITMVFLFLLSLSSRDESVGDHVSAAPEACLTSEEELLYAMIMDYRKANKLPPIPISQKLTKVAKAHAMDLVSNYTFDPSNRCNPHSWSKKGAWSSCCYTSDHKAASCMWEKPNEIAGYASHGYEIAYYSSAGANAKEGLDGWKVSPGHNPLLVNSGIWEQVEWKAIGIAIYKEYGLVWFGAAPDETVPEICN
jgi:uncharacterized protein YkwD